MNLVTELAATLRRIRRFFADNVNSRSAQSQDVPWTDAHMSWLKDTGQRLTTVDGTTVEVWELAHENDQLILSAWAKHLRNHYCLDVEIDYLRRGSKFSRSEYLNSIKFPDQKSNLGPSIRAGDFAEILVADFLQYLMDYWVPRTRYADKDIRDESTRGCDVIGFKMQDASGYDPSDILAIFESKTQFSGSNVKPRLQDAVDGSIKDQLRKAMSLNAIKQRLHDDQQIRIVERFQNFDDRPYTEVSGAAAIFSREYYSPANIIQTDTKKHPNSERLKLIVICGTNLMGLAHELFRRAAHEA